MNKELQKISVIGIVSFAAVVHSHLCWVYSIIYIAYHKISPPPLAARRRTIDTSNSKKTKTKKKHYRKKSLTSKPKTLIPSIKSSSVPILHAYSTFPSTKKSSIHKILLQQRSLDDSELLYSISSKEDLVTNTSNKRKRDRALSILRSTFNMKQPPSTHEDETTMYIPETTNKKSKQHAILQLTRKLSTKKERPKLLSLRSFSWKKDKKSDLLM